MADAPTCLAASMGRIHVYGCNKVVAEQHRNKEIYVCRVIYKSFEHDSTNQNQGPKLGLSIL